MNPEEKKEDDFMREEDGKGDGTRRTDYCFGRLVGVWTLPGTDGKRRLGIQKRDDISPF